MRSLSTWLVRPVCAGTGVGLIHGVERLGERPASPAHAEARGQRVVPGLGLDGAFGVPVLMTASGACSMPAISRRNPAGGEYGASTEMPYGRAELSRILV